MPRGEGFVFAFTALCRCGRVFRFHRFCLAFPIITDARTNGFLCHFSHKNPLSSERSSIYHVPLFLGFAARSLQICCVLALDGLGQFRVIASPLWRHPRFVLCRHALCATFGTAQTTILPSPSSRSKYATTCVLNKGRKQI